MKFKKFISLALSLTLASVSIIGCGKDNTAQNTGENAGGENTVQEQSEQINLKWALWDLESGPYFKKMAEAYMEKNENVTIEYVDLGSADYMTMLSTQLSGGADLDILTIKDIPGYANLVKQNHLEPLKDFVNQESIDISLYGGAVEQIETNDEIFALPFRSDFWVIYYNKALFDQAGVDYPTNDMTFEEYDEIARKMTSGSGSDKVYGSHYHTWRSAVQLFGILDGKNSVLDGEYEFFKPYYEMILNQQNDGIVQDYATLKTSSTHYSGVFFKNQVSMMNMGSWFIATQIEKVNSGESLSDQWGIVKYPHAEGVEPGTTLGVVTSLSVNPKSKNKETALDFLKFATSPEGAKVIADTGTIPAIKSEEVIASISSIDGFPTDEASKEALNTYKIYLEMPLHEKSSDIELVLNEAHDNIMTKNSTIDEGIEQMNERIQQILGN